MIFQSWGPPKPIDRKSLPYILVKIVYRYNGQNMETTYIFRQVCVYVCVCVCVCFCVCMCMCIYAGTCIYVHVHVSQFFICFKAWVRLAQ